MRNYMSRPHWWGLGNVLPRQSPSPSNRWNPYGSTQCSDNGKDFTGATAFLSAGKAPGSDGYTADFYKLASDTISPTLVTVYQKILKGNPYLPSRYQAHIKLIPKKEKDPSELGSYHPISLLNLDSKLLSKIMANRLTLVMLLLIHPSRTLCHLQH